MQLQAGSADLALASGEAVIKINADRWEGYALAGGALMNLKRYEDAADKFSKAIEKAPEAKQAALRDLRRQCLLAESGASPAPKASAPATTTQAEIVLWKSIENNSNVNDFRSYLAQYPNGTFAVLANQRVARLESEASDAKAAQERARHEEIERQHQEEIWTDPSTGLMWTKHNANNAQGMTWFDATSFCKNLNLGGLSGWRLPELQEFEEINDHSVQPNHNKGNLEFVKEPREHGWIFLWTATQKGSEDSFTYMFEHRNKVSHRKTDTSYSCECVHSKNQ